MNRYIPVETPGGLIWAEVEETDKSKNLTLTSSQDKTLRTFPETVKALRENAKFLLKTLEDLSPQEMEVSFGVKVGVEAGAPFFGLAKASGEGSYTVTLKWKAQEPDGK